MDKREWVALGVRDVELEVDIAAVFNVLHQIFGLGLIVVRFPLELRKTRPKDVYVEWRVQIRKSSRRPLAKKWALHKFINWPISRFFFFFFFNNSLCVFHLYIAAF